MFDHLRETKFPVPVQDTWWVLDSTKLITYMECERKFFYNYILGWRLDASPTNHLHFGSAFHAAMETLRREGMTLPGIEAAAKRFLTVYREKFPEDTDASFSPKTPTNAVKALFKYVQQFGDDPSELLETEIAGTAPIRDDRFMNFKIDVILRNADGKVYFGDYKTGSRFDARWRQQWSLSQQMAFYQHALFCWYKPELVAGGQVDGVFFYSSKEPEIHRVRVDKPLAMMEDWLYTTNLHVDNLQTDMETLADESDEEMILRAFPKRTTSCGNYGGCPYMDFCSTWSNPLQRCHQPPPGWRVEHWDPREKEADANVIVKLGQHGVEDVRKLHHTPTADASGSSTEPTVSDQNP